MSQATWRAVGDTGWLVELDPTGDHLLDARRVLSVATAVRAAADPRVVDVVPAATTVLVTTTSAHHRALGELLAVIDLGGEVASAVSGPSAAAGEDRSEGGAGAALVLPVRFDGVDLAAAAEDTGHSIQQLVDRVCGVTWTAAFSGFAPGFAYLVGGGLDVPRLPAPRPSVPPGSLALAGPYAGVYPRASPGGWRLVGSSADPRTLFDPARDPAALIAPGDLVRFVAQR